MLLPESGLGKGKNASHFVLVFYVGVGTVRQISRLFVHTVFACIFALTFAFT